MAHSVLVSICLLTIHCSHRKNLQSLSVKQTQFWLCFTFGVALDLQYYVCFCNKSLFSCLFIIYYDSDICCIYINTCFLFE